MLKYNLSSHQERIKQIKLIISEWVIKQQPKYLINTPFNFKNKIYSNSIYTKMMSDSKSSLPDNKVDMLYTNNFQYVGPTPSSCTLNRVLKRQVFGLRNYSASQTMVCQLNTGTDFVDCANSSIVFKIQTVGTPSYNVEFGEGSAMNIVRNIRIFHRSGTSYTNTQRMNLYRKTEDNMSESSEWFSTIGDLMGYGGGTLFSTAGSTEHTFVIPLSKLHPFFDPSDAVFLPPQMASGLRIEIDLSNPNEAFIETGSGTGANFVSYNITDVYINAMSVTLTDDAVSSVNQVSQSQSLEYVYRDVFTSVQPVSSTTLSVDVNRSVGYADSAYMLLQNTFGLSTIVDDAFVNPFLNGSWWFRLGSNQYPNQQITDEKNAYSTALITWDKFKSTVPPKTTFQLFSDVTGVYSVTLERDAALALSQSPVNASRALRFELTLDVDPGLNTYLSIIFLTYMSNSRSTMLSSKVDI
jgi:hypothetical protein